MNAAPHGRAVFLTLLVLVSVTACEPTERVFTAPADEARFEAGHLLFFDKELSGPRDIACSTCHLPFLQTTENLPLSIGVGGTGAGSTRTLGVGRIQPRNTSDIFNRGEPEATALFWDGRVERLSDGTIRSSLPLPERITTPLEAQVMHPLFSREEMRGLGRFGDELGQISDDRPDLFYAALAARIDRFPEYRTLFRDAFPGEAGPLVTMSKIARALAFFEATVWGGRTSEFDAPSGFPAPNQASIDRGRDLFFGAAGCASCHSGPLFSDMRYYDLAVPQIGPGKEGGLDEGRFLVTRNPSDRFAFRTAPLRNAALTGPWMHNGSLPTLRAAIAWHFDPDGSLRAYDGSALPSSLRATLRRDEATIAALVANIPAQLRMARPVSEQDLDDLVAFIQTLTAAGELTRAPGAGDPLTVPSGLPIDTWTGGGHPFRDTAGSSMMPGG